MSELLDELDALHRLIARLAAEIERLRQQFERTYEVARPRPPDDADEGSD